MAAICYRVLDGGEGFLSIGICRFAAVPGVSRHIPDQGKQPPIGIGAGNKLNPYIGETRQPRQTVQLSANVWRPAGVARRVHQGGPIRASYRPGAGQIQQFSGNWLDINNQLLYWSKNGAFSE